MAEIAKRFAFGMGARTQHRKKQGVRPAELFSGDPKGNGKLHNTYKASCMQPARPASLVSVCKHRKGSPGPKHQKKRGGRPATLITAPPLGNGRSVPQRGRCNKGRRAYRIILEFLGWASPLERPRGTAPRGRPNGPAQWTCPRSVGCEPGMPPRAMALWVP